MRKTYAYNGITLGIIFGIAAWAYTENSIVGIVVAVVGSVAIFALIRAIENGLSKAGDAITRSLDEKHSNK